MKPDREIECNLKRVIIMAANTCSYYFGAEYCESPLAENIKIVLLGVAMLLVVSALASVISFDASGLTGTEFFDGPAYLLQ